MKRKIILPLLFIFALPIQAQTISPIITEDEKLNCIGMTIAELIERFGAPKTVAVARGNETWQDDVVFQYDDSTLSADFYIFKDRVWQARFSSVCGISLRDRKAVVMLFLGDAAIDENDHALLSIPGKSWPISLRVNFNNTGQSAMVTSIFIYRPDF